MTIIGYCPGCGRRVSGLTMAGRGVCELHGWVWVEWNPPAGGSHDDDGGPIVTDPTNIDREETTT